uniref:Uncharacterized protein n=1 Tax=Rhizophora mucronata TaxID=61149 RepID=A0A2P2MRF2_RHIMU
MSNKFLLQFSSVPFA